MPLDGKQHDFIKRAGRTEQAVRNTRVALAYHHHNTGFEWLVSYVEDIPDTTGGTVDVVFDGGDEDPGDPTTIVLTRDGVWVVSWDFRVNTTADTSPDAPVVCVPTKNGFLLPPDRVRELESLKRDPAFYSAPYPLWQRARGQAVFTGVAGDAVGVRLQLGAESVTILDLLGSPGVRTRGTVDLLHCRTD